MAETENWARILLFIACFMGFFAFLVGAMPSFITSGSSMRDQYYPDYLSADEIAMYSDWWNDTITTVYSKSYVLGNHDFNIVAHYTNNYFQHSHYHWFLFIPVNQHGMEWYDYEGRKVSEIKAGTYAITKEDMDANFDPTDKRCEFTVRCKHVFIKVFFSFDTGLYTLPSEAWQNSALGFTSAITMDQVGTSWNSWSLIASILFFQAPTQDFPFIIQLFIALPFWVSTGYLIYRLILLALPFVG